MSEKDMQDDNISAYFYCNNVMRCLFFFSSLYVLAMILLMYASQQNKCNNINYYMQVLLTIYVYKGSNWGSRTFQGNASKPSKRRVPRPKVGFGALERVQYSLSVCGDSRGHIGESWV